MAHENGQNLDHDARVEQALAEYMLRVDTGESVDRDAFLAAHADLADGLREYFDDAEAVGLSSNAAPRPVAEGNTVARFPVVFGDYELLSEIDRGNMGVVYRARQRRLDRTVAVKMILAGKLATAADVGRFLSEARTAANLQHPRIVTIHEVGEYEGRHFFSMDYIEGKSLADLVRDQPLATQRAARYVKLVAEAIHFAHLQGILHRDIKPSNVLIDSHDEPHVTDFGIAKRVSEESDLTATGSVVGTPSYMSPEQASAAHEQVSTRSDVYSLGALLYALVTGRPPFAAENPVATIMQVLSEEPVPPRRLNPALDADLETICLKCLEKEPSHRYESAQDLADELDRYLQHLPIRARPISRSVRLVRWCRRNPAMASAVAVVFVLLAAVALTSTFGFISTSRALDQVGRERHRAEQALRVAEEERQTALSAQSLAEVQRDAARRAKDEEIRQRRIAETQSAEAMRQEELARQAQEREATERQRAEQAAVRESEASRLADQRRELAEEAQAQTERQRTLAQLGAYNVQLARAWEVYEQTPQQALAMLEDEELFPDTLRDFTWGLLHRSCQRHLLTIEAHEGSVHDLAFVPDGTSLVSVGYDKTIRFWDPRTGVQVNAIVVENRVLEKVAFSPDGKLLAVATRKPTFDLNEGFVQLYDMSLATLRFELTGHVGTVASLAFSPDCSRLAVATHGRRFAGDSSGRQGEIKIWNTTSGEAELTLTGTAKSVRDVAFVGDGTTLVSAGDDNLLRTWNLKNGQQQSSREVPHLYLSSCRFSPDGGTIAHVRVQGKTIMLNDALSGERTLSISPRTVSDHVTERIAFSPQEHLIAAAETHIRVFNLANGSLQCELDTRGPRLLGIAVAPDAQSFATADEKGLIKLWRISPDLSRPIDARSRGTTAAFAFSSDNETLLAVDANGRQGRWDTTTGREMVGNEQLPLGWSSVDCLAVSPGGKYLAVAGEVRGASRDQAHRLLLLDPLSGKWTDVDAQPRDRIRHVFFAGDGHAVGWLDGSRGGVGLYDVMAERLTHVHNRFSDAFFHVAACSADGKWIAAAGDVIGSSRGIVSLWDVAQPENAKPLITTADDSFYCVAFSLDGRFLAAGGLQDILLWEVPSGRNFARLKGHRERILSLAFSPDGKTLASSSWDRTIRLWDPATGQERAILNGHSERVTMVQFSSAGTILGSASADGTIRLWNATDWHRRDTSNGAANESAKQPAR